MTKCTTPLSQWHTSPEPVAVERSNAEKGAGLSGRKIYKATYVYPGKEY